MLMRFGALKDFVGFFLLRFQEKRIRDSVKKIQFSFTTFAIVAVSYSTLYIDSYTK